MWRQKCLNDAVTQQKRQWKRLTSTSTSLAVLKPFKHLNNQLMRHSWDFSISFDCRWFLSDFSICSHREFFTNRKYLQALVHRNINLLITYFALIVFVSQFEFYWIAQQCVNKFSLRASTLNSRLVREEQQWGRHSVIKLRSLLSVWTSHLS